MKRTILATLVAALMLAVGLPAGAITQGTPDGNDHPMVGQLLFHVPTATDPRFTSRARGTRAPARSSRRRSC
jgi:hypothetical protein